jgi:YesN/AraC family two-component response regulator
MYNIISTQMINYKYNVLIVEDELLIAWDIKNLLEQVSINAHIVKDYESAITSLSEKKHNLVIIDVYLGKGKSGIDLGTILSQEFNIPFIFLTSYSDINTIERIIKTKPYGFITKPYKKVDLLTSVQIAINTNNFDKIDSIKFDSNFENEISYTIKKVINYIEINIKNKIEIDELVALTKWSKCHFIRVFTNQMNIAPYTYILNIKIEHAKIMILNRNSKLEYVAYDLGFQSYVNFARTFKKYTKYSPKEYRNINKTNLNFHLQDVSSF